MINKYLALKSESSVIVYQYGKVGSTSLCQALGSGINAHDLYGNVMCPPGFKYRYSLLYRLLFSFERFFRRCLIRARKKIVIIVPLRKPDERNISMFFQDLPFWYVHYFSKNKAYAKGEGIDILREIFLKSFPHQFCDFWFDAEFSRFTGIKLEQINFNVKAGFGVAESGKYKCLFIHHDVINTEVGRREIKKITGEEVDIVSANRGEKKWYQGAYREFCGSGSFVVDYKEKISKESRVYRKFYSV